MGKRGISIMISIVAIIFIASILGIAAFIVFSGDSESSETGGTSADTLDTNESENQTITVVEITECAGYSDQESCESDSNNIGNCIWNSNASLCEIETEEETNETTEPCSNLRKFAHHQMKILLLQN